MQILYLTAVIYIYLLFLGWGVSRLTLPESFSRYQIWLAPWLGLSIAALGCVWLSSFGIGTRNALVPISSVALLFALVCIWRGMPLFVRPTAIDGVFFAGFFVTLAITLSPLFRLSMPTTISIGNNDPALYAGLADLLKSQGIWQVSTIVPAQPVISLLVAHAYDYRLGTFLLLALLSSLVRLPAYKVFCVVLALVTSLTPPLVAIFAESVSASPFAALLALALSIANLNLIYAYAHGFAGQLFGQGCLIIVFAFLWQSESDTRKWRSFVIPSALSLAALLSIYPEAATPFAAAYSVYAVFEFAKTNSRKVDIVLRLASVPLLAVLADPFGAWGTFSRTVAAHNVVAGWPIPRWLLPVDMVGLMSPYGIQTWVKFDVALAASFAVAVFSLRGLVRWRVPRLTGSVLVTVISLLLYEGLVRDFSYGYYKIAVLFAFIPIAALASGLAAVDLTGHPVLARYARISLAPAFVVISLIVARPLAFAMFKHSLSVSDELAELGQLSRIVGTHFVRVDETRNWEQMWVAYFLQPVPIILSRPMPYFAFIPQPRASPDFILRPRGRGTASSDPVAVGGSIVWRNRGYELIKVTGELK